MTDDELRALIRDSIARHLGAAAPEPAPYEGAALRLHPSHGRFRLASGGDGDGACLIEPAVKCVHCGYCQSYGH